MPSYYRASTIADECDRPTASTCRFGRSDPGVSLSGPRGARARGRDAHALEQLRPGDEQRDGAHDDLLAEQRRGPIGSFAAVSKQNFTVEFFQGLQ